MFDGFIKNIRNNRGIALLMTITIITLVIVATLELHRKVRSAVISTAFTRDHVTLSMMASSGTHAAMAMLIKDKMESASDSLQEDWANPEKINEVLKDITFEDGSVSIQIIDELNKIQVNALVTSPGGRSFNEKQRILWDRFLNWLIMQDEAFEEIESVTIIDSLKDWMDSGDDDAITGLNGAESDYYLDLEPPYPCRNKPINHLGELMRIKGITLELFHGLGEIDGMSKYTTIYGISASNTAFYEGKININTADIPVLISLLPVGSEDMAQAIIDFRQETDGTQYLNNLSSPTWYKQVPGMSDIELDNTLITTSSDIYRIVSIANLHDMKKTITAVVQREQDAITGKWLCRVLSWESG